MVSISLVRGYSSITRRIPLISQADGSLQRISPENTFRGWWALVHFFPPGHHVPEQPLLEKRRARIETLRDRFVAVSMRSRTLRLSKLSRHAAVDLRRLITDDAALADVLGALGAEHHEPVALCPVVDHVSTTSIADHVSSLSKAALAERIESGVDTLSIGWPFLQGKSPDGTWLRAPLFIFPARLHKTTAGKLRWMLEPDAAPSLNDTLVQLLVKLFGVKMTFDAFLERDDDNLIRPDQETWRGILETLASFDIGVSTPVDSEHTIERFDDWYVADRDALVPGQLELRAHAVLARFPLAATSVVLDYQELLDTTLDDDALGAATALVDPAPDERSLTHTSDIEHRRMAWRPFMSDSSQDLVASRVVSSSGRGTVVQGPPGTGKSQMIANLVCDALERGDSVLIVCQKRAALEVVATRLADVGLVEPLAMVHDVRKDRNDVCQQLAAAISRALEVDPARRAGDDARLEASRRAHQRASLQIDSLLDRADTAWGEHAALGAQIPGLFELEERALVDDGRALPDLQAFAPDTTEVMAHECLPVLQSLTADAARFVAPDPLAMRGDWSELQVDAIRGALAELERALDALAAVSRHATLSPARARQDRAYIEEFESIRAFLRDSDASALEDFCLFWMWCDGDSDDGAWLEVTKRLKRGRAELAPVPYKLVLEDASLLEAWIAALEELERLEGRWWRFFSPTFWRLRKIPALVLERCEGFGDPSENLPVNLAALCRGALAWQQLIQELPSDSAFFDFGFQGDPSQIDDAIESVRVNFEVVSAIHAFHKTSAPRAEVYASLPDLYVVEPTNLSSLPFFGALLADGEIDAAFSEVLAALDAVGFMRSAWIEELRGMADEGRAVEALERVNALGGRDSAFEDVIALDVASKGLPAAAIEFSRTYTPGVAGVVADFTTSMERAWKAWRLEAGEHAVVAPLVDMAARSQLRAALDERRHHASFALLQRYRSAILDDTSDSERRVALQKLLAQARKQRYRLSLRQIVEQFWSRGLREIKPVWLCSPDSVASLFPAQRGMFDLVIFDEASQCPVESSIGALVRAKAVVIAGDDQQMPPSHFFKSARSEDELGDEDEPLLAAESLIESARGALDNVTLRWHYRSKFEELIAFSNAAFYGGRLLTAPRPRSDGRQPWEGLSLQNCAGVWREQTNLEEARAAVDVIADLLSLDEPPTVGVVTFNLKQAALIESELARRAIDDAAFDAAWRADHRRGLSDRLFVRNLENVQGDERDVIIMSVGYGPDEDGNLAMRFGPLSLEGGERRLNVAITRARRAMKILTSFDPSELSVSNAKNKGPRLLHAFLSYARAVEDDAREALDAALASASAVAGAAGVTASASVASAGIGREFVERVYDALVGRGLIVERDIGLGDLHLDLGVRAPGGGGASVGLDLTQYLYITDVMTREVYAPRFWSRAGWEIVRVTPGQWRDRSEEVVRDIYERLGVEPSSQRQG